MITVFYILNFLLLLSGLCAPLLSENDRKFSLALLRVLIALPLLAAQYVYLVNLAQLSAVPLILLAEIIFAFAWYSMIYWLDRTLNEEDEEESVFPAERIVGLAVLATTVSLLFEPPGFSIEEGKVFFSQDKLFFLSNLIVLCGMLAVAWRLEGFWRSLSPAQRWEFKSLLAGALLTCCTLGWAVAYRFTYHRMAADHFRLMAALMIFAWGLMFYAVARHRLLNRKIFVSRKVVYASIVPLAFGVYLVAIGVAALIMQYLNVTFPIVLRWFFWIAGLVFLALLGVSGKVRHSVRYFISTHFYTNKYEYRDEWLAFSRLLQGALSEMEVIDALHQVMIRSLYTNHIFIWTGDNEGGYRLIFYKLTPADTSQIACLPPDHPLIESLGTHTHYYAEEKDHPYLSPEAILPLQSGPGLVLFVPIRTGEETLGLIGLGPEFTGGRYGEDDFDLLFALGAQTASALQAARMAEKVARNRQQEAWDVMSAFILHDVKNAASMLSLIHQNAGQYMDDPDFQQDLLEGIDDAVRRMNKVQNRLSVIKREIVPVWQNLDFSELLAEAAVKLEKRLQRLDIHCRFSGIQPIRTDPELFLRILENLLLNTLQAGGSDVDIRLRHSRTGFITVELTDNGPGIPQNLLPDALFAPFRTTRPKGSGVGLWQARRLASVLGGTLTAENRDTGGARFSLSLPLHVKNG